MKSLNDDLLVKVIVGEATEEETRQVNEWLAADTGNRKYFTGLQKTWEASALLKTDQEIDVDKAWADFRARTAKEIPLKPQKRRWWMAAAAAVLLVSGVWIWWSGTETRELTYTAENFIKTDTLPDGSTVTLNQNAVLKYSGSTSGKKYREVTLQGEAFFHVQPDSSRPFIISTGETRITVLGTSFNVKTKGRKTEVIVESGLVQVENARQMARVKPGEKITSDSLHLEKQPVKDEFHRYYRTGKLVCNDTPLQELVMNLNEIYGVNIEIENPALGQEKINTVFDHLPLPDILRVISETLHLKVIQTPDKIILR